ncbi:MAG: hypothetical protein BZY80_01145 [SAR202 cluster bacterium Io17-Chloro-G2]|nr:MAG: hypothetical protein BZY80_01145 [SAR202 cluster bacterium Io17-Chloro-G2]
MLEDLQLQINRRLGETLSLKDFEIWVVAHLQSFLDSADDAAISAINGVDAALIQLDDEVISIDEFRLELRLLAALQITKPMAKESGGVEFEPPVEFGGILLDQRTHRVTRNGQELHLTPVEHKLLDVFVRHQGNVLTASQLLAEVWGPDYAGEQQLLRTFISRLRKKIDPHPSGASLISTERGVGYRLNLPVGSPVRQLQR